MPCTITTRPPLHGIRDDATEVHYSLFDGFTNLWGDPTTFGHLKHDLKDGSWRPYCMSRPEIGFSHDETAPTFPSKEAALAWVQGVHDEAMAAYEARVDTVMAQLRADLSPVEDYHRSHSDADAYCVVVQLSFEDRFACKTRMTIQEALTALDFRRLGKGPNVTIGSYLHGERLQYDSYCHWTMPEWDRKFYLLGWRSCIAHRRAA